MPKSNILAGWGWCLWLLFTISDRVASRLKMETVDDMILIDQIAIVGYVVAIVSGLFCLAVISEVTRDQETRAQLIAANIGAGGVSAARKF